MTIRRGDFSKKTPFVACTLLLISACSSSSGGGSSGGSQGGQSSSSVSGSAGSSGSSGGSSSSSSSSKSSAAGQSAGASSSSSQSGGQTTGGSSSAQAGNTGTGGKATTGGQTTGGTTGNQTSGATSGGQTAGATGGGGTATAGATGGGTGGKTGGTSGQAGNTGSGGQSSGTKPDGGVASACVGKPIPTADPTKAGPFKVFAEKNVGPKAGALPDPIYGNEQQRFNIYRPDKIEESEYCHPILVWANGHSDNPEPNGPCVLDGKNNKWCGQYLPILQHLASHGFVVIASLSTITGTEPLPTIAGLDWLLDPKSVAYYDRLDTANIGQLGHSFGGMSTCMSASEPRYKALATICGTATLKGVHTPMMFFCGGKDDRVGCDGVKTVFQSVKDQPAFFMNETASDHGSWVYGGPGSPSLSGAAAWFRVFLMDDTANRKFFYGPNCTFCKDNRVKVEQNSLMAQ
jgi:hypothetical protein